MNDTQLRRFDCYFDARYPAILARAELFVAHR